MITRWLVLAIVACRSPVPDTSELGSLHATHRVTPLADRSRLRHAMRAQRDALRDLEGALARGQLEESRALAFSIARADRGLPSPLSARVTTMAHRIANAITLEQAALSISGLVVACTGCHSFPTGLAAGRDAQRLHLE